MRTSTFDFVVIGGGIFGVYAALHLAKKRANVLLLEKDAQLFHRASRINQARLHGGYHYPRSLATARLAHEYQAKFKRDHHEMINSNFEQYYGIDKNSSFTSASQFESFCHYLGLPLKEVAVPSYLNPNGFEALYLTEEYSFDPHQLASFYLSKLEDHPKIKVMTNTFVRSAEENHHLWDITMQSSSAIQPTTIKANSVVNATYSSLNAVNHLFGQECFAMTHEIAEIVIVSSPLKNTGLTVMDGDFASFMPFGNTGHLSLSSVRYTRHATCEGDLPQFSCQQNIKKCRPDDCQACNDCIAKPKSNQWKMMHQMGKYLSSETKFDYLYSMYTLKSKLKSSYIDDSRPTMIRRLQEAPEYHCLFGGKISSIYEIENHFNV